MQILLPGEQVMPLPKSSKKNKNNKNKPNGFISFANAQRKHLQAQFTIRSQEHLVSLCDPMWRKLQPDEKKMWNTLAKDEHARALSGNKRNGVRVDNAASRMDCNGKIIAERQNAERSSELRRQRERQFVNRELERCEEVVDLEFCIIDCLTAIDYTDGECVPCEIGVVKASIREGIIDNYHFFPDPGALRPGFIAEAQIRTDTIHEVPYENFNLASKEYATDAANLLKLIKGHEHSPKTPMLFCRSSEYKYVQSCLDWLSWRVDLDFSLQVMELESFCVDLVTFTKNEPPTFAQIRRLLFETRYDFQAKTRCDFHSMTDKANCAIGNVRKYFFFLSELLYDYYQFYLKEGLHYPKGFKRPKAAGSSVCTRSEYDFDDATSVRSDAFSISSFVQNRAPRAPFTQDEDNRATPVPRAPFTDNNRGPCAGNVRQLGDDGMIGDDMSQCSVNSFSSRGRGRSHTPVEGFSQMSLRSGGAEGVSATVPRKPIVTKCYDESGLTYDTHKGSQKSQNSFAPSVTPPPRVNSFSQSSTPSQTLSHTRSLPLKPPSAFSQNSFSQDTRPVSPVRSIGRGSSPVCGAPPPGFAPISPPRLTPSIGGSSLGRGRGRGRGQSVAPELPRKPHSVQKKDKF